ncbi:Mannose-P-dolichol utilization defect 1 protein [Labeo rohita]|uniref:Solute carrier family 66 member 3 n=1 Tax=Labeo rohita TaxID=84645 RepID=A0ABQ8MPM9_LABRO|nr:mannose-P-dolichol utilization defect 1a isoform X2 [Labeo rohita]KAI2664789.1 Mannose-P-dolichol utilization defect 1 protein [Labeo rohita]
MDTSGEGTMTPLKDFLLTFFMPEKCYDQFFLYFSFLHVPCLKIVLSKTMGILILVGIVIAPLPQIWKVFWSGSSVGLCLTSVFLELLAISTHAAFCYTQNFPIGAWGESLFALIQIAVLALLVQHYRGKTIKGIYLLALYCGFMFLVASPLTPVSAVWTLHEWNVLLVIAGRVTGLSLSTQMHAVACCCSGVILAQVLMYWNKCMTNSEKEGQVEKDKAD